MLDLKNDQIEKVYAEERTCTSSVSVADFRASLCSSAVNRSSTFTATQLQLLVTRILKTLANTHSQKTNSEGMTTNPQKCVNYTGKKSKAGPSA